jgi:hypothetical protein
LDAIGRFAVKMLDLETNFFVPIMVFDLPDIKPVLPELKLLNN